MPSEQNMSGIFFVFLFFEFELEFDFAIKGLETQRNLRAGIVHSVPKEQLANQKLASHTYWHQALLKHWEYIKELEKDI